MVPNAIVVDKSRDLVETWSTPIQTLPGNVLEPLVCVNGDLMEDKKVSLSHYQFMRLLSQEVDEKSICSEADLSQLFRHSEDENGDYLWESYLRSTIYRGPPDENGIEASYISF